MNRMQHTLFVLLGMAPGILIAQEAQPEPPYLRKAAENSSWNIRITPKHVHSTPTITPESPTPDAVKPTRFLQEIQVDKIGQNRCEVKKWSDGSSSQMWRRGDAILVEDAQSGKIFVMRVSRLSEIQKKAFSSHTSDGDFPDFMWIDKGSFVGIDKKDKLRCLKFQSRPPNDAFNQIPESPNRRVTAWVDLETRTPLLIETPDERREYFFVAPRNPDFPLHFQKALDDFQKGEKTPNVYDGRP